MAASEIPERRPANQGHLCTLAHRSLPGCRSLEGNDLHTNDHVFLKGHRIMVQVQSTWFPIIDRNPQKYAPNIFEAAAADYQKATQRIYCSKKLPSSIELPITVH
ncbi:MAG: CocE/NonD family hydrolase C-terminal non-catalytic domain-containing protein [Candidatus Sulfotelmatobacter sp.]|jgi:predicted acyl esterase